MTTSVEPEGQPNDTEDLAGSLATFEQHSDFCSQLPTACWEAWLTQRICCRKLLFVGTRLLRTRSNPPELSLSPSLLVCASIISNQRGYDGNRTPASGSRWSPIRKTTRRTSCVSMNHFPALVGLNAIDPTLLKSMAGTMRSEPATSAETTRLGFGCLGAGSHAPISRVNAGRESLLRRDLLEEHAELFTFGRGQRRA